MRLFVFVCLPLGVALAASLLLLRPTTPEASAARYAEALEARNVVAALWHLHAGARAGDVAAARTLAAAYRNGYLSAEPHRSSAHAPLVLVALPGQRALWERRHARIREQNAASADPQRRLSAARDLLHGSNREDAQHARAEALLAALAEEGVQEAWADLAVYHLNRGLASEDTSAWARGEAAAWRAAYAGHEGITELLCVHRGFVPRGQRPAAVTDEMVEGCLARVRQGREEAERSRVAA